MNGASVVSICNSAALPEVVLERASRYPTPSKNDVAFTPASKSLIRSIKSASVSSASISIVAIVTPSIT